MILDLIAIFRARKRPADAAKLAARFAHGQAIDRVATPVIVLQLALWAVCGLCLLLVGLIVFGAASLHGALAWIAILPGLVGLLAGYVALGIGRGLEAVKQRVSALSDRGLDRLTERRKQARPLEDTSPP